MRIRRVEILSSPGIRPGFEIDGFGDGVTIILGRNESGKSTLASAIRALLWPDRHDSLRARGTFERDDRVHESFVDLRSGGWLGEAPPVPDSGAARSIVVGIGDLWTEDEHDRSLRRAMTQELQGGYDIVSIRESLSPTTPVAPQRELQKALQALHAARGEAQALIAEEARLPELRDRAEQLSQEANARPAIEAALRRIDQLSAISTDEQKLAQLPAGALKLNGDEGRHVAMFQRTIEEAATEADQAQQAANEARQAIDGLGLPVGGVNAGDMDLLQRLAGEAEALRQQIDQAQQQADRAAAASQVVTADRGPLDTATLDRIDRAMLEVQAARERMSRDAALAEAQPAPAQSGDRSSRLALSILVLLAAVFAGVAGAWIALGVAVCALVLSVWLLARASSSSDDNVPLARAQAERSAAAYEERLVALREIAGEDAEVESTLSLVVAAKRAQRSDETLREMHAARAGVESLEAQLKDVLERSSVVLASLGSEPCHSTSDLFRMLGSTRDRAQAYRQHCHELQSAEERRLNAHQRVVSARRDYERFLERLGLADDRLDELREWLRHREQAQALADRLRDSRAVLASLNASLKGSEALLDLDRSALEDALREGKSSEAERSNVLQRIGEIEGSIRRSRQRADVQGCIGSVEQAAEAVVQARDHECAKAARRLIIAGASAELRQDDMPDIVRQADAMLDQFTEGSYALRIDDDGEPVLRDVQRGATKTHEQLSTGTRAQVMLALRLAGAQEAERRAGSGPMPLVLDEPLATTDLVRFDAVAKAMCELAKAGRQLVYLTCEPTHAQRLASRASNENCPCTQLDLDAIRKRASTVQIPRQALLEPKPTPSPATMSRKKYLEARGLTRLDPWEPTESIDLYHLLADDLDTLHELDRHGLRTVGQVLAQHDRLGERFHWPAVAEAAMVATRLLEAWRRGRARPLTAKDIEASGAAGKYLGRLIDLNRDLGGSARALVEAIEAREDERVKGFRTEKAAALRMHLESHGLLPIAGPASRADAIWHALGDLSLGKSAHSDSRLAMANHLLAQFDAASGQEFEAQAELQA